MLEGLEVSEVNKSKLEYSGRIDSEYYRKTFLCFENIVFSKKHVSLSEVADFLIGPFGSSFDTDNYVESKDYRYVRGQDVKPFILKDLDSKFIPYDDFYRLKKYSLKENDVLVSVVGTLGNACIVQKKDLPAIFSCKSTVIRTNKVDPTYLLTYFNCKYGKELLLRKERGAIQKGLNLDDLRTTLLPMFSDRFQCFIKGLFFDSQIKIKNSFNSYRIAETILLDTLGLQDFEPSNEPVNVKKFSESFLASGRLDAEYYQRKYEDYLTFIQNHTTGFALLKDVCKIKDTNFNPNDNIEYKYIELSNIGKTGEINGCTLAKGVELPTRARRKVNEGDVVISSIEGSLESCAIVSEDYDNSLCSTGFYVINSLEINSETLLVLFKSQPLQNLLKKNCSGTILTAINKTEFQNIPIPIIEKNIQQQIAEKIEESFRLKRESERLLELAKRAVEVAIEEGEEVGVEMMSSFAKASEDGE